MKRGGLVTRSDAGNDQFFLADNRLGAFRPLSGWAPHVTFPCFHVCPRFSFARCHHRCYAIERDFWKRQDAGSGHFFSLNGFKRRID